MNSFVLVCFIWTLFFYMQKKHANIKSPKVDRDRKRKRSKTKRIRRRQPIIITHSL